MIKLIRLIKIFAVESLKNNVCKYLLLAAITPLLIYITNGIPSPTDGLSGAVYRFFSGDLRQTDNEKYVIPIVWIFIHLFICFISLKRPLSNICGNIAIRSERARIYLADTLSAAVSALAAYLVIYSELLIISGFSALSIIMLIPPALGAAYSSVLRLLSLLIGNKTAYLIVSAEVIASTYLKSPILLGNYAQLARVHNITVVPIIGLGVFSVCLAIGTVIFTKKDIIFGEKND